MVSLTTSLCLASSCLEQLLSLHSIPRRYLQRAVARIIWPLLTMHPQPQSVVMVVLEMVGKLERYVIHTTEWKWSRKARI